MLYMEKDGIRRKKHGAGKEFINGKGVKISYHRIDSIYMVDGMERTVKSYIDEYYRQQKKEKES